MKLEQQAIGQIPDMYTKLLYDHYSKIEQFEAFTATDGTEYNAFESFLLTLDGWANVGVATSPTPSAPGLIVTVVWTAVGTLDIFRFNNQDLKFHREVEL